MIYLPPRRAVDVHQAAALLADDPETPIMDLARGLDWAYDRFLTAAQRAVERGLLESIAQHPRVDSCPTCAAERFELVVVPGRFYCRCCKIATEGPNTEAPRDPEPEQIDLFEPSNPPPPPKGKDLMHDLMGSLGMEDPAYSSAAEEGPPIDEGMAWVGEEGSDE